MATFARLVRLSGAVLATAVLAAPVLAIVLAGIQGHDLLDVARLLGLPEGTVKSRLFLARKRLKEMLQ